jgi:Dual specificity phosphatase, catalytic domain
MTAHDDTSPKREPPWAWIKCLRDITDPCHSRPLVDLPVELLPWLLLSDRKSAMDLRKLKEYRVTHILSAHAVPPREELYYQERLKGTGINHKRVSCDDTEGYDMMGRHWGGCLEFLKMVRETPGARVVVHCVAGINRSGLLCCAAQMVLEQQPVLVVVRHILDKRGSVLWNRSFQRQLCDLAQQEHLLGPVPPGYNDDPLIDTLAAPLPAHSIIDLQTSTERLSDLLGNRLIERQAY